MSKSKSKTVLAWGVFDGPDLRGVASSRRMGRTIAEPGMVVQRIRITRLPNAGNRKSA